MNDNNSVEKKKIIQHNTSIIDINIIEAPLFISSKKEVINIGKLEENYNISSGVKRAIEILKEDLEKSPTPIDYRNYPSVYRNWVDSRGKNRELFVIHSIPDMTTMDVWNGLIGLYIQKIAPICYDESTNMYDIPNDEMEFTLYELAKFMNKSTGGKSLERLIKEIYKLKYATYHSLGEGVIFNKKNDKYLRSKGKGFNLILDCEFESEKRVKGEIVRAKCKVQFNRVIIDNIRYEYIKYINPKEYFSLPSRGLARRLYSYVKGNLYFSNKQPVRYIKRSLNVLKNKIPIYEKHPSKIKERLISGLKYLKAFGVISDYFFGDEVLINNIKERCIYIIFEGSKEEIVDRLSMKYKQIAISIDDYEDDAKFRLYIPKDIRQELISLGASEDFTNKIVKEKDKWEIIKYILWLEEEKTKRKISNPAGLLNFALTTDNVKLELTHKHIVDYVENEKSNAKTSKMDLQQQIENAYIKYVDKEIREFKKDNVGAYELVYENLLAVLNNDVEKKISEFKLLLSDGSINEQDKLSLEKQKQEWLAFEKSQDKSKLFKKKLQNNISQMLVLKGFEDFKNEQMTLACGE
ncbi:replication initiator protein A [Clostridium aestuarii]|uniref:Replication initiator protein A n=1 Tax=Clostridium aestuarii TaxID=338193 RepID=A0ABT4D2N2_9CLOT|nr:replication initiator protein A [Clostridium aestuarii]MCY6485489.1 replication initiator protein A [Clostridium aestuarii]